ncbi:MAG TPA: thioredoxin [Spirochaetia bacterium]|nr:thioredoxin [Spirochaetia bacterium]
MSQEVQLTTDTFKSEVLESGVPVLVDFWAPWCMPCKMMEPILKQAAEEYDGKVKIAKLNVDEESDIAAQFNIVSIPTMLLFVKGEVVEKKVGAVPKPILDELVNKHI